jgi:type IV secretory pathway VirB9-like protein
VKPPILIIVSCGLALAANAHASTTPEPRHLQPNAPRTITVSEADTPPVIRTGLLQSTLILLPAEEKVATVFGGDTVNWVFDGGHVASRFISVKPKVAGASTDVHIVSDHGNEYTLQLREITGDEDPHFDSKIFIAPGDQAAKDKLAAMPVFVPAAELDKAKQETPALYELKDKKGSLINFDYNNGLYTVPKELDHGYLSIGKQKVEFHRVEGRN